MRIKTIMTLAIAFPLLSVNAFAQAEKFDVYSEGRAMVSAEQSVNPGTFFIDNAPDGYLREQCEMVCDMNSACNAEMGNQSFKSYIEFYNEFPVKRRSWLFSNYSNAADEEAMDRIFRMTVPYFEKNKIVPIEPRQENVLKGVKNYSTFFAVGRNRVGYKAVVSLSDCWMTAVLGFVRFDGLWYLTESHVGFLEYQE